MAARLAVSRKGSVSLISALMFPVLIGMTGLGVEYANGVMTQVQNQRVADLAAYGGAIAYNNTSSTTSLNSAVTNIATLNGLPGNSASAALVSSPSGNGHQAVQVTVTRNVPVVLSTLIGGSNQLAVSATAYAELTPNASPCVIALNASGSGITLSGGTSLSAPGCSVASNTSVSVPCGTTLTTKVVYYNTTTPSSPCKGIVAPSGSSLTLTKKPTTDPLSGNSSVAAAVGRLTTVAAITSPAAPSLSATNDIDFAYNQSGTISQATAAGCSASYASNTWTLTCSGSTVNFRNITMGGGITVKFNTGGSASTTYNISGSINNSGTAMTFGPGTYNIAKGLITGGGTTTIFAAGTFNIGRSSTACSGGGQYSICNTSTLIISGPSTFVLSGGIYNSGGAKITLGGGATNSYQIGASSDGNSIYMGGGSSTTFADATGNSSVFQLAGRVNVASGGGSCLLLPAASQHDINGNVITAGGTLLGAGVYTVNGYVGLGANGGGDVTCNGTSVGMSGAGVTFVISGTTLPTSGNCANQAFCLAAGYSNVTLTAPTSGTTNSLVVVGPTSSSYTGGASLTDGASGTSLSGIMYFPYGPVTMGGGATLGNGTGQCLEVIGSQISLTGGSALASTCTGLGGRAANSATVMLVQ
jgi:hypothetical protein